MLFDICGLEFILVLCLAEDKKKLREEFFDSDCFFLTDSWKFSTHAFNSSKFQLLRSSPFSFWDVQKLRNYI